MPTSLITNAAIPLLAAATGNATAVDITEIALADCGSAAYDPTATQTDLVNERLRVPIETRRFLAPQRWRIMGEMPSDVAEFPMRELGFYAADCTMIGIWAGQRTAFGGKISGRNFGISADRPARFNLTTLEADLEALHKRLSDVTVTCMGYAEFITRIDRKGALFYLDPPYWGCETDYGKVLFERADFERLAGS